MQIRLRVGDKRAPRSGQPFTVRDIAGHRNLSECGRKRTLWDGQKSPRAGARVTTNSALVSPTPCGPTTDYVVTQSVGASIVPGTDDIGNHCDLCLTAVQLPFAFYLYGEGFNSVNISSKGHIQFSNAFTFFENSCLPDPQLEYSILPFWDDLRTNCTDCGIFTSVSGVAPIASST